MLWGDPAVKLPKRKAVRLRGYDYSAPGAYFITICVKNRQQLLSKIVGDGVLDVPQNQLTFYGNIANKHILAMGDFYNNILIEKYVIMPNHIHLLLRITETDGTSGRPSPTNSLISKFVGTFKRLCNKEYGRNIWQRQSHDHIIRGEKDYQKIWEYIATNVIRWESDCFYNR